MEAAREGHEEMVALLLSQGADINAQTEETQETALTLACCGGFIEVADFLIKAGADIQLGASTPLMEAAQEGHYDLVHYITDHILHPESQEFRPLPQLSLKHVFFSCMVGRHLRNGEWDVI